MQDTKRVAIMQPYWWPYLGYFQLMASVDIWVVLDCVQFPRRGYVHRNQYRHTNGQLYWFTLPLKKCELCTAIRELQWHSEAPRLFDERLERISGDYSLSQTWRTRVTPAFDRAPIDYLLTSLQTAAVSLGINVPVVRSSHLLERQPLTCAVTAQERILHLVKACGATHYVNLSGGVRLYHPEVFSAHGIELGFMEPYRGDYQSTLVRVLSEPRETLMNEVRQGQVDWVTVEEVVS